MSSYMTVENEYKFTSTRDIDRKGLLKDLSALLIDRDLGYSLSTNWHIDTYYDSEDLGITKKGCFLRMRDYCDGRFKMTVKRPVEENGNLLSREEIERPSDGDVSDVVSFGNELFPDTAVSERPVLTLKALRSTFKYNDNGKRKLTLDECTFMYGQNSITFWELELECMSDDVTAGFDDIGLESFLSDKGMVPVFNSKYERGLEWKAHIIDRA